MRLSKRIYKIAEKISPGETAADIGTDHGYVPMLLMRGGISPHVIMSDISEGSLAKAKETFAICALDAEPDCFRVGDGLETVDAGEVDAVIISGLGGLTIIDILSADPEKSRSFRKLVLQPRKHSGNLRHFLYTHGWDITDEDLAPEGKFVCEVITAVPAGVTVREELFPADDIRWKYPAEMVKADPELARRRIGWKISSLEEQIDNLRSSPADRSDKIASLESDLRYLQDLYEDGDHE